MFYKYITTFVIFLILSGCASVNSVPLGNVDNPGLTYYMPERDLVITVTVGDPTNDKKKQRIALLNTEVTAKGALAAKEKDPTKKKKLLAEIETASAKIKALDAEIKIKHPEVVEANASVTEAYPDLQHAYVVNFQSNPFGKSTLDIGVSQRGLLSSAISNNEPQFSLLLNTGASQAAKIAKNAVPPTLDGCAGVGKYVFIEKFKDISAQPLCGTSLTLSVATFSSHKSGVKSSAATESVSGIYYRQNRPYKVTLDAPGKFVTESLVFSPSGSPNFLLPVKRSFFAKGDATLTFSDGVPTKYEQETEGEIIALLKLPADVISAYAKAVGGVFDSFAQSTKSETSAEQAEILLELAKQKNEACLDAITDGDDALIEKLECGSAD